MSTSSSRFSALLRLLPLSCCLLAARPAPAQIDWDCKECFTMIKASVSANQLGYSSLNKWLRANGASGADPIEPGLGFDVAFVDDGAWLGLEVYGLATGNERIQQFGLMLLAGPRYTLGRVVFTPGLGLGIGSVESPGLQLPYFSCPTGDCVVSFDAAYTSLLLNQMYRFPSRKRRTSVLLGGYVQPLLRLGRARWEYGYYTDDSEWVGTRIPEVPSVPRVQLVVGLTVGVAIVPK